MRDGSIYDHGTCPGLLRNEPTAPGHLETAGRPRTTDDGSHEEYPRGCLRNLMRGRANSSAPGNGTIRIARRECGHVFDGGFRGTENAPRVPHVSHTKNTSRSRSRVMRMAEAQ
jgi:hypothetical protein